MLFCPDAFARFAEARKNDLRRISRATQGECSPGDVENEAFILAATLVSKGTALHLDDRSHQELLIRHLYQSLVRYTELNVRHAVRLDHSPSGEEDEAHPLRNKLAAAEEFDPAVSVARSQDEALVDQQDPTPHESLAGAYVHLLRMFDNRMPRVAEHLLLSVSHSYRRVAQAKVLAALQRSLMEVCRRPEDGFVPKAWRRFKLKRTPEQLNFDFDAGVELFAGPL